MTELRYGTVSSRTPASGADRRMPPWIPKAIALGLVGVAAFMAASWAFDRLKALLVILVVSMFLALAIEPAVNLLAARGMRRGFATMLVFVLLFSGMVGFTVAVGSLLVSELTSLADNLPTYADQLIRLINDTFGTRLSAQELTRQLSSDSGVLQKYGQSAATNVVDLSASVVGGLFKLLTVVLFGFYLSAEGPKFRRYVVSLFPPGRQGEVLRAWEITIDKTGGYIYSRLLMAFASFLAHYLVFMLIGLNYAFALAAWVGLISQFIPTVGTYLAGSLPMLVALAEQPLDALWILIFVLVYQQFENYLIQPRITAKTLQVHPAVAFGSVIAGAALLGPVGAFIGIPVAASAQAFFSSYIRTYEVTDTRRDELRRIQAEAHHQAAREPSAPGGRGQDDRTGRPRVPTPQGTGPDTGSDTGSDTGRETGPDLDTGTDTAGSGGKDPERGT
jgi:predicted PurR-regulated permease PerM